MDRPAMKRPGEPRNDTQFSFAGETDDDDPRARHGWARYRQAGQRLSGSMLILWAAVERLWASQVSNADII
jgi:hypothetical protein